jgi:hypothetical protein
MSRADAMAERLPPVYDIRRDTLIGQLLDHFALPLEAVDDERIRIQRAHWITTSVERADLAKLAALLDLTIEPWEPSELFRDRVQATARARLAGAVARGPIEGFVADLVQAARERLGLDVAAAGGTSGPALVENPAVTSRMVAGALTPLDTIDLHNAGLDPAPLQANLIGLPGTRAAVPVLAAIDRGLLLGWAGVIPAGSRFRLRAEAGSLTAKLDGEDVGDRLFSVSGFEPGRSLTRENITSPAEPLMLPPGTTRIWYVTAGLFDRPELDAVMFAVARGSLRQGRFDEDEFGDALFHQPPPLWAELFWRSPAPASFDVRIPAGAVVATAPLWPDRPEARDRLGFLIGQGVHALRAAGVRDRTQLVPLHDQVALTDCAVVGERAVLADGVRRPPTSEPPDFGALLDVTPLDHSRLE